MYLYIFHVCIIHIFYVFMYIYIYIYSTQENKHRTGLDFFLSCIIRTAGPKKAESANSTLYDPGCGSQVQTGTENWHRKPMHVFNFVSDQVRSYA